MDDGRTPTAKVFTRQMELSHIGMLFQHRVNGLAQLPNAFPVNDADSQNPARATLGQIVQHEILDLTRLKRVQVEHAIDRHLDWLVIHAAI